MRTRRNRTLKRRRHRKMTMKRFGGKTSTIGKKWVTAIDAAQKTLKRTGNIEAAKKSLRKQALSNARKLFGSIGSSI
jgi:hypothetical protein